MLNTAKKKKRLRSLPLHQILEGHRRSGEDMLLYHILPLVAYCIC